MSGRTRALDAQDAKVTQARALAMVRERGGAELSERLAHLDRVQMDKRVRSASGPGSSAGGDASLGALDREARPDVDVVMAGGGLSLLVAAELARLGLSVVVLERSKAGRAHREWNASDRELRALVDGSIATSAELERFVVARYERGICRFHRGTPHVVRGALDVAVDAVPFLDHVRALAESRGVRFVDGATLDGVGAGERAVRVGWKENGAAHEMTARVLVDARGASSPYATADLICPTVGGVMKGIRRGQGRREIDPGTGEILVTINDAPPGELQEVWEAFPGRPGETTVYVFTYARAADSSRCTLAHLYARFFAELPAYKEGDTTLVRPTFGYIPGWSRLTPAPHAPSKRIVLVGDAAARHSPLTMCGFGSMLRNFAPSARAIAEAVGANRAPGDVTHEDAVHKWTGALAQVMASGALGPKLNDLLDAAFSALEEMGNDDFAALLQDRMEGPRFTDFLRRTARRKVAYVYRPVLRALGPLQTARWGFRLARELRS